MKTGYLGLKALNKNLVSILLFEVFYKAIAFAIFTPLLRQLFSFSLATSNITSLTNNNFMQYIFNPYTIILAIFAIFILTMFMMLEITAIAKALDAGFHDKKITVTKMTQEGISAAIRVFNRKNWAVIIFLLFLLPFTNIIEVSSYFKSFQIPEFIKEALESYKYYRIILYSLNIILIFFVVKYIFSFIYYSNEKLDFNKSLKKSSILMKKHYIKMMLGILGWTLFYALVFIIILSFTIILSFIIIMGIEHKINPYLEVITISSIVNEGLLEIYKLITPSLMLTFLMNRFYIYKIKNNEKIVEYNEPKSTSSGIKKIRMIVILACVVMVTINIVDRVSGYNPNYEKVMVMAHRGNSTVAPENTLPAFMSAIEVGADAIELDVQLTKDGEVIVLHDTNLARTTGIKKNVWDVTYDEIKDLDNGSFFSPEFSSTKIPTLRQVLELCKNKIYLNIEIKKTKHGDGIEQKVIDLINEYDFQNECDITSLDYKTIETVERLDPSIKTVYTTTVAYGKLIDLKAADAFSIESTFVNESLVKAMRKHNKQIFVWTVSNESQMQKMIDLDVDAIITNNPVLCKTLIKEAKTPDRIKNFVRMLIDDYNARTINLNT